MLKRLSLFFGWEKPPFKYLPRNGAGYAVTAYNPFTDKVTVRKSYCGLVKEHVIMTLKEFEDIK